MNTHFTIREQQAAQHLKLGLTDKEIAGKIHCSERAAKEYVIKVREKLYAKNRTIAALKLNGIQI